MCTAIPLYFVNFSFHYLFRDCKIRNWNELIFCNFVLGSRRRTGNYDNLLWSSLLIGPKGTMKFGTVNKNFHTKEYHTVMMRMRTRNPHQKRNENRANGRELTHQVNHLVIITENIAGIMFVEWIKIKEYWLEGIDSLIKG